MNAFRRQFAEFVEFVADLARPDTFRQFIGDVVWAAKSMFRD